MNSPEPTMPRSRKIIRLVTLVNFSIFVLLVIPVAHRWVDRGFLALRAINLEDPVGWSLQIWLVVSTLVITTLFGQMVWKNRRATSAGLAVSPLKYEGMLVLTWWLVVLGACAYGYMLGMGG
jgi:hypothetical protein